MALSLSSFMRRSFTVRALELADCEILSTLHEEDFARAWTEDEFEVLVGQESVFGFAAVEDGLPGARPVGFVLARRAAGEAEILTITVSRVLRRRGIGRALMDAVLRTLHTERVESLFLEVDENNTAAIALYRRFGFNEVGQRPDYYRQSATKRGNALVMRRDLPWEGRR